MPPHRQPPAPPPPMPYGYAIEQDFRRQPGCLTGCAFAILSVYRLAWRYRWQLTPIGVALAALVVGATIRTLVFEHPEQVRRAAATTGALTAAVAAGLWFGGHLVRLDRPIERAYAATVALAAGAWLTAAVWVGAWAGPMFRIWAALTIASSVPWWWHRRIRRRTWSGIQRWKADLEQHESGSLVGRPRFDPDGGCAIPWELPPGRTIDDIRPEVGRLESLLDLRPGAIEIDQDQARKRLVWLRISPRDPHKQALAYPGPPRDASITRPVTLGRYLDGGPARTPLPGPHALIAGASGSGKSGVLNVIIAELAACPDVVLWGCDLKHGLELGPWEAVFGRIATTPDQAAELLEALVQVQQARGEELARRKLRTWPVSPTMPALVGVIDEHKPLAANQRAITAIETLTAQGRAMAVGLIDTTQYPTVAALGSSLIAPQCAVKVCLRVNTPGEANVILGPGSASAGWKAHEIPKGKPGTLYLDAPGADSPRLARAYHLTDQMVGRMARAYAGRRPTLDPVSQQAASPAGHPPADPGGNPPPSLGGSPPSAHWASPTPRPPARPPGGPGGTTHDGPGGTATIAAERDPHRRLRMALAAAGERGAKVAELAEATGMRKTWIYARLQELLAAGEVTRGAPGCWCLAPGKEGGLRPR